MWPIGMSEKKSHQQESNKSNINNSLTSRRTDDGKKSE